jgi:hypothetical protein
MIYGTAPVTNLADAGVDTEMIMKIVGHSSVEMFLRCRTIKAERLNSATARLDAAINSPATSARTQLAKSAVN